MTDLRKAAEMALETLETTWGNGSEGTLKQWEETIQALRQALAHEALDEMVAENQRLGFYDDGPAVKTYAGGKPNYCTPLQSDRIRIDHVTGDVGIGTVDAVNMTQERVDETAKGEHEPVAWRNTETGDFCSGGFLRKDLARWVPLYLAPPKREWVWLTKEEMFELFEKYSDRPFSLMLATHDKLKEKNS